jgi:hypothetical protein
MCNVWGRREIHTWLLGVGSNMKQGDCLKTEVYVEDNNAKMDLEMGWRAWT